jgi:hypothetical protein
MHRRHLLLAVIGLALLPATAARADDDDDLEDLIEVLEDQGYDKIELEQTMLGRTRILARKDGGTREIIINARTGEVLRDVWIDQRGRSRPADLADHRGRGRGRGGDDDNSGSGKDGGDDD